MTPHRRDQSRPHRRHADASDPSEAPGDAGTACDPGQFGQPGTAGALGDPGSPGGRGEPDGHGAPRRTRVRVVVVGAGPHGLAAALHLAATDPGIRDGLVVVDRMGGWLQAWDERFACLEIEHLRSPGVHHPGCDPYGLVGWTKRNGFGSSRRWRYELPDTVAFRAYCRHLVAEADLDEHVVPTRARRLDAGPDTSTVVLGDGTELVADHVMVATDPARRALPTWVADALPVPADTMAHAADVDLRALDGELDGRRVVVLGGGLTAGHLACGALARGASVTVLARRPLRE